QKRFGSTGRSQAERDAETRNVVRALFTDLKRVNQSHSSRLVLVHLPTLSELGGVDPWSAFIKDVAREEQIPLISVIDAFRSRTDARDLFFVEGTAGGHYNNAGHAFAAQLIVEQLKALVHREPW